MGGFLKRILTGRFESLTRAADLGNGDWSPVPVSAAAQSANVMVWLQGQDYQPPPKRAAAVSGRPRRATIRRLYMRLTGEPEQPPIAKTSAAEERDDPTLPTSRSTLDDDPTLPRVLPNADHVVPASLPASRPVSVAFSPRSSPVLDDPSSTTHAAMEASSSRAGEEADFARDESDWHNVLKQYGEHLTEEELRIIRKQLA
jgi:hypothetical protein